MFDFVASTGELWRNGVPVRLQAQPAKVLSVLVAQAGEIVSREALQREVWPDGTHVDFERGLNFCVAQVRSALGDSADSPRYVETIPKQGYRFVAPVAAVVPPVSAGEPARSPASLPARASSGSRRAILVATGIAAVVVTAVTAALVVTPRFSPLPTVVVVPFYNETGRPDLDPLARSLGDGVVASLAAAPRAGRLSVIGNAPSLRNPFARQDVQQIARDLRAEWVLIGQLKTDGTRLRLIAHLIRSGDMKHLWAQPFDDDRFALEAQSQTAERIASEVEGRIR